MKRTIIAVISIVLIAFAFTACRPTVVGIPVDPTPSTPVTPSDPSIPENTIQVGGKSYHNLDEAIADAPENGTINIGKGRFIIPSTLTLSKNLTINGAGMNDTIIEVYGDYGFDVDGNSTTISNLTIADTSDTVVRLINVHSSQLKIDSVKLEGKYVSGNIGKSGIVADSDVTDITILNSVFKGIRVPLNFDLEHGESPKVTISGNTFDTFQKLAFTTDIESMNISSDNVFENYDEEAEFQIELFDKGDLTADKAIEVAKATGLVVKAELEEKTYYYFDAEGFIIDDIDDLKSFAAGKAGTKAKLVNLIEVTEPITFSANDLVLVGNEEAVISATMESGKHQSEVFVLNGTGITLYSVYFEAGDDNTNRIDFVIANGKNATVEKCVFTGTDAAKEGTLIIYGVTSYADNTSVIGNTFEKLRIPFYFYENRSSNGKATGNTVTGCLKIDLESAALVDAITGNTIINTPVNILKGGTAEIAKKLATANGCTVTVDGITYDAEGALISTVEQLGKFASGQAGTVAKLVNEEAITITSRIKFTVNGLTLNADNKPIESNVTEGIVILGSGITINEAVISYTGTGSGVLIKNQGEGTKILGGKFTGIYETTESDSFNGITSNKPLTVENAEFSKFRLPVYTDDETAGSVIRGNTFDTCFKVEVKADELDSVTLIGNTFTNRLAPSDIVITGEATEETAKTISENNNGCNVAYGESLIYPKNN